MKPVHSANRGILVSVIMHMLRTVATTPQVRQQFLRGALKKLAYNKIIDDYDTFFLHDLVFDDDLPLSCLGKDTLEV